MAPYNIAQISTMQADALKRLLTQYSADRAPVLRAIVSTHADRWQEIENALFQILTITSITLSEGVQLDNIGAILNQPRGGADDPTYRGILFVRIAELNSQGTPEEMISIFANLTGLGPIFYAEYYPAAFYMEAEGTSSLLPVSGDLVYQGIQTAKPAGVGFYILVYDADYFGFLEDPDADTFGDVNDPTVGGYFPELLF
jgi:hypothetical protein